MLSLLLLLLIIIIMMYSRYCSLFTGVLAYRWIQEYCPHAKLIVKVDDDMFVNPFVLHEVFYKEHSQASRRIVCHVRLKSTSSILRGQNSKWRVLFFGVFILALFTCLLFLF